MTKKIFLRLSLVLSLVLVPFLASADPTIKTLITGVAIPILNMLVALIMALAVVAFFWGVAQYVISQSDSAEKQNGKSFMIWGIVAIFVMVSVWGLVRLLDKTFNLVNDKVNYPQFPNSSSVE